MTLAKGLRGAIAIFGFLYDYVVSRVVVQEITIREGVKHSSQQ
jgi:hypothetical protein